MFKRKIADLERRISTVISEAFDDCVSITAALKLLDSFHGMLQRESVERDFTEKYLLLLEDYRFVFFPLFFSNFGLGWFGVAFFRRMLPTPPLSHTLLYWLWFELHCVDLCQFVTLDHVDLPLMLIFPSSSLSPPPHGQR